jgi:hypothetical protein
MSRPRFSRQRAVFPSGYQNRNPLLLLVYRMAVASPRLRSFVASLPPSRLRTALMALFMHHLYGQAHGYTVNGVVSPSLTSPRSIITGFAQSPSRTMMFSGFRSRCVTR